MTQLLAPELRGQEEGRPYGLGDLSFRVEVAAPLALCRLWESLTGAGNSEGSVALCRSVTWYVRIFFPGYGYPSFRWAHV